MSEPMTNVEIEDVLSSIRRLVSEDFRTAPASQPRSAEKLVLTPALRVVSDNDENDTPEDLATVITSEAAAAVVETALSSALDEWEPDGSEPDAADWAAQWNLERDRQVRLHLGLIEGADASHPEEEVGAVVDTPQADLVAEAVEENEFFDEDEFVADEQKLLQQDISEDGLREMVREIIREELQGELGEKITRSVRKLVRAEINRALALHDIR